MRATRCAVLLRAFSPWSFVTLCCAIGADDPWRCLLRRSHLLHDLNGFCFAVVYKTRKLTTMAPANSNESYCTFTLASDVTAGGLPSEEEIAKDLESSDDNVRLVRCRDCLE